MATVKIYKQDGNTDGTVELNDALFSVEPDKALVHAAVVTQEANSREAIAHTKDRAAVRGADRKPWRQKGTGRARHGSRYSPIWRGGGVTFGPTNERNFSKKMNKKARRKALAMVLSDKVANDRFIVADSLKLDEPKTRLFVDVLKQLPSGDEKTLVVLHPEEKDLVNRVANNVPHVTTISATSLNVVDLLSHNWLLASEKAVELIQETYKRA